MAGVVPWRHDKLATAATALEGAPAPHAAGPPPPLESSLRALLAVLSAQPTRSARLCPSAEGEKRLKKLERALGKEGIEFRPESYKWSCVQVPTNFGGCRVDGSVCQRLSVGCG